MAVLRALLVGLTMVALVTLPFSLRGAPAVGQPVLAAATDTLAGGVVQQDDNDNATADDNDNGDEVASDNENDNEPAAVASAPEPPDVVTACVATGTQGDVKLVQDAGSGTLTVMNQPQDTQVTLTDVSPNDVPSPPGVVVSDFVFNISASTPCGAGAGPGLASLPAGVNFGVSYDPNQFSVLDEGTFAIMRLDGDRWVEVTGFARDPNHDFISATITQMGTYAVVAR